MKTRTLSEGSFPGGARDDRPMFGRSRVARVGAVAAFAAVALGCGNSSGTKSPSSAGAGNAGGDSSAGASAVGGAANNGGAGMIADAGAVPDYNPCANQSTPCLIMPLGDSITYGDQSSDHAGYRSRLFHLALQNQQSITFVGGQTDGPDTVDGVPFPKHHEGHSGYEIAGPSGILPFTAMALTGTPPQVVLLEIGTNDFAFNNDPPNAPKRLGDLLDVIYQTNPNLLVVVAQITPTQDDPTNAEILVYNAAIPALVASKSAAGMHVFMIDNYDVLASNPSYKTDYLANEYHPNDAGYTKMAENWYAKVGPLFPKAP